METIQTALLPSLGYFIVTFGMGAFIVYLAYGSGLIVPRPRTPEPEEETRFKCLSAQLQKERRERKQGEDALRKSENNLRKLSQSLDERTTAFEEQTARLRHLANELVSAEQRERKRLASLLHNDLQQLLIAAGMELSILKKRVPREDVQAVERAGSRIDKATSAARDLTCQLRPPALYEEGFVTSLHWLASRTQDLHRVEVIIAGEEPARRIGDALNALLFDCVRELVLNAVKHAGVKQVVVSIREEKECLRINVQDEGQGFDVEAAQRQAHSGFGLFSIRERLLALGGNLFIESAKGKGTRVQLDVPLSLPEVDGAEDAGTPSGADRL